MPRPDLHPPRSHYRALDGLRAVAMLSVFYYHTTIGNMHLPAAQLGWVGVDLFFVLSGFLITGVLLQTRGTVNYFRVFYARRALRIFPVYYLVVAAVFCAHYLFGTYPSYRWTTQVWFWVNASNFPTAVNYFSVPDLVHFWTLAIEEQFYLLWPLMVYRFRNRSLMFLCAAAFPLEYALRLLPAVARMDVVNEHQFSSRLTPLHSEGLFAGAAVAIMLSEGIIGPKTLGLLRRVAVCVGIFAFVSVRWNAAPQWIIALRFSLLAVACAALIAILVVQSGDGSLSRILSAPPLRFMGRMSFSIYVLHVPIIHYFEHHAFREPTSRAALFGEAAIYLLVTMVIARIVWWAIEEPALALKRHFPYRATVKGTAS